MSGVGMSADETPWLDDRQQQAWRAWLAMGSRPPAALNRQLQRDSDLSLQDFDVLVQLTRHRGRAGAGHRSNWPCLCTSY